MRTSETQKITQLRRLLKQAYTAMHNIHSHIEADYASDENGNPRLKRAYYKFIKVQEALRKQLNVNKPKAPR